MIATVTLNPALDHTILLREPLIKGTVNRTQASSVTAGGKGINGSVLLRRLGVETIAHGCLAGATGAMIADWMRTAEVPTDWLTIPQQENRINLKLSENGVVTELNASGLTLSPADCANLLRRLNSYGETDYLVFAGSLPNGVPVTQYADWMQQLQPNRVRIAVDTEGEALRATLPFHPFVIKPNLPELSALFGTALSDWHDALPLGKKLLQMGAQMVLLSLGADGALLFLPECPAFYCPAPHGTVRNPVGAGDSMLAGFLAACATGSPPQEALRRGIAAGSATAFSDGLADAPTIAAVLQSCPTPQPVS